MSTDIQNNDTEMRETIEALQQITQQRMSTYHLLSRLYRTEVDQTFLDELSGLRFPAKTGNADADTGYRLIATYLSNLWNNSLTELAVDYVKTFIGHGIDAYSAAYPYESVYTSKKRLLMQEARDEVLAIYRSAGLNKLDSWKENEDHIAMELEFMQILSKRILDALDKDDLDAATSLFATQQNFLEDHLVSWVPMMTDDIKRFAQTDLYKGLAFLTDGFLKTESEFLGDLLAEPEEETN